MGDASQRQPWTEGPDAEAPPESWLLLNDDELLHRIETFDARENEDERLLEVVASHRHFFIRQEAAKRVQDRTRLFAFEDDRHVGQILVRHLTRREDMTYLERLSSRSTHVEVRSAAQVQLARLWRRLDAPDSAPLAATEPVEPAPPPVLPTAVPEPTPVPAAARAPVAAPVSQPVSTPTSAPTATVGPAAARKPVPAPARKPPKAAVPAAAVEPVTSAPLEKGGVDGSLLAWAAHFLVELSWSELGTRGTRELLTQTRRELLGRHPTLVFFEVTPDAHVAANLDGGPRLPGDCVKAVASWMVAFRSAARAVAPGFTPISVRAATATMADALRDAGFYAACDTAESETFP